MLDYTAHQTDAITLAIDALKQKRKLLRIGGYAGAGKTTCLKEVYNCVPGGAIVAFAGKACEVLRRKGLPGQTIHSLIYKWNEADQQFYLVEGLEGIEWVGVDEGSMVGTALWGDLVSFGLPTLVIGDPGQLEPVNDEDPHLMRDPDYTLTEIHRQALNSPIIRLSMQIREGNEVNWGSFARPMHAINDELMWADMVICGRNKTRCLVNSAIRKAKGFKCVFEEGERLICKNNDKGLGVFNGQMFTVVSIDSDGRYTVLADGYNTPRKINLTTDGLNQLNKLPWSKVKRHVGKRMIVDYGYAITCHGAQGSEYEKVAYMDEQCDLWCPVRHRYTGVTRASSELRVYTDGY